MLALNAAAPVFGAAAGILAYFTWNAAVFGGVVPVSAATKRRWYLLQWEQEGGYSLTESVRVFLRTGFFDTELLVALEVCGYTALVWWSSRRSRGRDDRLLLAFLVGLSGLAAGHLAKFAQSVLTAHPAGVRFDWYFVPAYLMGTLVVPARCCVAVWSVRRFLGPELRRASGIPSLGIVAAGAVHLFAAADFAAPFRFVDRNREAVSRDTQTDSYMGTTVMNHLLPEDSVVITASGSGIEGYFSRFPVVNGDGLVNSWDYLRAVREGNTAALVRRYGITHLVHYTPQSHPTGDDTLFQGLRHLNFEGNFSEFRVRLASGKAWGGDDRAAGFWERMKPHLERRADGGGLLVDGRLAQAFVPDCADALAAWTWAGQEEPAPMAWVQTSIGFCISAIVLPPDARPPVRVAAVAAGEYLAARFEGHRPAIDSDFDVYLVENRLVYVNESCGPEDVDAGFYLHVNPVDPDDVPPPWREGWDNLDFRFRDHRGLMFDGACLVDVPLPAYRIAEIRTGQRFPGGWQGEIRFEPAAGQGGGQ